jgi:SAM-dependent methyltransferase
MTSASSRPCLTDGQMASELTVPAVMDIGDNPAWYHTIDLPDGRSTPGYVDWRRHARRVLPQSLAGLRCLDVGTYDGFWAFEMESRGASVTAIDVATLDQAAWPPISRARLVADAELFGLELGRGFRIAHALRGSSVERVTCDVLDLSESAVGGRFDQVFLGALLLHLRDPIRALENIRNVLKPGGRLILVEAISLPETILHPRTPLARFDTMTNAMNWWLPNVRTLHHYLWAAGFVSSTRRGGLLRPPSRPEMRCWYYGLEALAPAME